jgi:hypothetical protein
MPLHTHQDGYYLKKKEEENECLQECGKVKTLALFGGNVK